jgi:hypothetical protein
MLMVTSVLLYSEDSHRYDEHVFVIPTWRRFTSVNKTVTVTARPSWEQVYQQLPLVWFEVS